VDDDGRLDPTRTCLLFFDTSNLYVNGPSLQRADRSPDANAAVRNWQRQLARARELGMPVAYGLTGHRADQMTAFRRLTDMDTGGSLYPDGPRRQGPSRAVAGAPEMAVVDEIAPGPTDYVIWKPRWNPFHQTALDLSLRVRGVNTIILNGGSIEVGVAATVYAIQALDYDLVIVSDGCISRHADCAEILMNRVFPRIGIIRTTDEVLAMLAPAGNPIGEGSGNR
jgi:ureidoacrylate peracid hydrolase